MNILFTVLYFNSHHRLHGEKELITKSLQNALNEKDSMNERIKEIAEKSSSGQKAYIATIKEVFKGYFEVDYHVMKLML